MRTVEIVRQKQRLDELFEKIRALDTDVELQSHWSRYLCVLVLGFIENSLRTILSKFAEQRADKRVANYVESQLREVKRKGWQDIGLDRKL